MVQLLANPDQYDGKGITVIGFLRFEFEGNELYLHEDDYRNGISKDGFWVSLDPRVRDDANKLNMHYVLAVGVFDARNKGHMSMTSGEIRVTFVELWPRRHVGESKPSR
jgi:hypothetical protein